MAYWIYLARVIGLIANILSIAIFIRAILSWFPVSGNNIFVAIIYQITEPILAPLRRVIPPIGGMDLSPLVAILILQFVAQAL
ncbi:MAG: YggT family protein [Chloroflexi bacterium]|nr:YggT family protein [Chloroflexota bacterium]